MTLFIKSVDAGTEGRGLAGTSGTSGNDGTDPCYDILLRQITRLQLLSVVMVITTNIAHYN